MPRDPTHEHLEQLVEDRARMLELGVSDERGVSRDIREDERAFASRHGF
jgi:hypothetical protein